jgi:hypothetical protein
MLLNEVLNSTIPYKITHKSNDQFIAEFRVLTNVYEVEGIKFKALHNTPEFWSIEFGIINTDGDGNPLEDDDSARKMGVERTGGEFTVFAAVVDICKFFVTTYQPSMVVLSADTTSRQRLYKRLCNTFFKDWSLSNPNPNTFHLIRKS